MDLIQVLTVIGIAIANIGTTIGLFILSTNRSEENIREGNRLIEAMDNKLEKSLEGIRQEMRDFHGRLCAIEERSKGK